MAAALVIALVLSNLAWLYYSKQREEHHDTVVDVLLERIQRPERIPQKNTPEPVDTPPVYEDEIHLVGRTVMGNGDEPPDEAA